MRWFFILLFCFCFCPSEAFSVVKNNVKKYGAKGDGLTDDTKAIQQAVNSKGTVFFPKGTYLITNTLNIKSDIILEGKEAVIKMSTPLTMIKLSGKESIVRGIELDGKQKAVHGIEASSSCKIVKISQCKLHGFMGTKKDQSNAICCMPGIKKIVIRGCDFFDIDAPTNGIVGDLYGSCQGVLITRVENCLIEKCVFRDVRSEEDGDCIQVFGGINAYGKWGSSPVTIRNCTFYNIWHRAIKLQASDCGVSNCRVDADSTRRPAAAIEVFGDNSYVRGTEVKLDYGFHALTITGDDCWLTNCCFSVDADKKHREELTEIKSDVVYCTGARCYVKGNRFRGGYIGFYSPGAKDKLIIKNNYFFESFVRNLRIYDMQSASVTIKNNYFEGNPIPIDFTGGKSFFIVNNKMAAQGSYIDVLGTTFEGIISSNYSLEGKDIRYKCRDSKKGQ